MAYDYLLIDINGLGYASMYVPALAGLQSSDGFQTGAIHGCLQSVALLSKTFPTAMPVILWDRPVAWRTALLPGYMESRRSDPAKQAIRAAYKMQTPIVQQMFAALGIPQISCGEAEADDLAGMVARNIDPSHRVLLCSKDSDWLQALQEHVDLYSPLSKVLMRKEDLADPTHPMNKLDGHFLSTFEYLEAKALAGDSSDEIPGVDGIGMKTATKIIREFGNSIHDFWGCVDDGHKSKGVKQDRLASQESRDIFERNIRLMDWGLAPALRTDLLACWMQTPSKTDFFDLCEEFSLKKSSEHGTMFLKMNRSNFSEKMDVLERTFYPETMLQKEKCSEY